MDLQAGALIRSKVYFFQVRERTATVFAFELFGTCCGFECFCLELSEPINNCTTCFVLATHKMRARCLDILVRSSTNSLVEIIDSSLAHLSRSIFITQLLRINYIN